MTVDRRARGQTALSALERRIFAAGFAAAALAAALALAGCAPDAAGHISAPRSITGDTSPAAAPQSGAIAGDNHREVS
jgi:hypothetical protein